jgi:hypothetical protein
MAHREARSGPSGRNADSGVSAPIARGRRWLDELVSGSVTSAEQIALRERCSIRHVNSLAFLAPKLVRAGVAGGCLGASTSRGYAMLRRNGLASSKRSGLDPQQ